MNILVMLIFSLSIHFCILQEYPVMEGYAWMHFTTVNIAPFKCLEVSANDSRCIARRLTTDDDFHKTLAFCTMDDANPNCTYDLGSDTKIEETHIFSNDPPYYEILVFMKNENSFHWWHLSRDLDPIKAMYGILGKKHVVHAGFLHIGGSHLTGVLRYLTRDGKYVPGMACISHSGSWSLPSYASGELLWYDGPNP